MTVEKTCSTFGDAKLTANVSGLVRNIATCPAEFAMAHMDRGTDRTIYLCQEKGNVCPGASTCNERVGHGPYNKHHSLSRDGYLQRNMQVWVCRVRLQGYVHTPDQSAELPANKGGEGRGRAGGGRGQSAHK